MKSVVEEWVEQGIRKGKREGKKQGVLEVAKKMKAKGEAISYIVELTGLTVDDVIKL